MSRWLAVLRKRLRDHAAILGLGSALVCLVCLMFVYLNSLIDSVQQLQQVWGTLLGLFKAVTGREAPDQAMRMSVPRFVAGAYLTGMVQLALVAFPIAVAARGLAGEIGEGTVDLLGAQPLSRGALYAANAAVIGIGAAVLGGVGFLTIHVAGRFAHTIEPLPMDRFAWVAVNAASLSICTGGIAMLCSASVSDHGRAVMGPAAAIAATAVFELMASMWDVLDGVRWVGLYFYFNPLHIADGQVHQWMAGTMAPETWAWLSSSVLLRIGAACMLAGYLVYRRRDIATI